MEGASEMIVAFLPSKGKKKTCFLNRQIITFSIWYGCKWESWVPRCSSLCILFALRVFFLMSLNIVVVGCCGCCCWLDMWVVN